MQGERKEKQQRIWSLTRIPPGHTLKAREFWIHLEPSTVLKLAEHTTPKRNFRASWKQARIIQEGIRKQLFHVCFLMTFLKSRWFICSESIVDRADLWNVIINELGEKRNNCSSDPTCFQSDGSVC